MAPLTPLVFLQLLCVVVSSPTTEKPCLPNQSLVDPNKVHFPDDPLCTACLTLLGVGRTVFGNPISPIYNVLNTVCGFLPFCPVFRDIVMAYFENTPDRLSCRRILMCPGDWFDIDIDKREAVYDLQKSDDIYNILSGNFAVNETERTQLNVAVKSSLENLTNALGFKDTTQLDTLSDLITTALQRIISAHEYISNRKLENK